MTTPPPRLLPVLERLKASYLVWYEYYQKLEKIHRYTLGLRIDALLIETIEGVACAAFLARAEKQPYVRLAIRKLDTVKILLMILWESGSLENKRYAALSAPLDDVGKQLGGWNGQLAKQNSPANAREK